MRATKDEAKQAFRDAVSDLFREVCDKDRIPAAIAAEGSAHMGAQVEALLREFDGSVDWDGLCEAFTAADIRRVLADILRPQLLQMLAPLRPS